MTAANFWTKLAPKYAKDPIADQAAYDYTLGRTRSYLSQDDYVLELGCGTGSTALQIAPGVAHITATDFAKGMIAIAEEKRAAAGIENMTCVVTDRVLADGPFQAVLAFNLFHLVPDMEGLFAEIHAQLPAGGFFISKTPCLKGMGASPKALTIFGLLTVALPIMRLLGKAPSVHRLTVAELESAMTDAGFEIVEAGNHPKGPPPARYIVARKTAT